MKSCWFLRLPSSLWPARLWFRSLKHKRSYYSVASENIIWLWEASNLSKRSKGNQNTRALTRHGRHAMRADRRKLNICTIQDYLILHVDYLCVNFLVFCYLSRISKYACITYVKYLLYYWHFFPFASFAYIFGNSGRAKGKVKGTNSKSRSSRARLRSQRQPRWTSPCLLARCSRIPQRWDLGVGGKRCSRQQEILNHSTSPPTCWAQRLRAEQTVGWSHHLTRR